MTRDSGLYHATAARSQQFPVFMIEFIHEVAVYGLYEKIKLHIEEKVRLVELPEIKHIIERFRDTYKNVGGGGSSDLIEP